jgi:hypothetical protein
MPHSGHDLAFAFAAVLLAAIGASVATTRLTRAASGRARVGVLIAVVGALVLYVAFLYDRLTLARLLPVADVMVMGNIIPLLAGAIMGLLWAAPGIGRVRKIALLLVLSLATLRVVAAPWVGPRPACGDLWEKGVCRQTTGASCGPAAAATVLAAHGDG